MYARFPFLVGYLATHAGAQENSTINRTVLRLYGAEGLTAGQPFPGNLIPANLIDQNAVLEVNAGTFPKPNDGTSQYISSIPQTTNVREDVVRIDHTINSQVAVDGPPAARTGHRQLSPLWGEFGGGNNGLDANLGDANLGQAVAAYDPRTLQLGAKLHF